MQNLIPALNANGYYSLSNQKFLTFEEVEGEEKLWIEKYQILQYNNLFDKRRGELMLYR